jgi:hypothetical protein
VLVGHSYGGAVITEAGRHRDVAALVYIAAFVPDKDESVNALIGGFPADGPQPPLLPPRDGFLLLDQEKFPPSFAGDVPAEQAVTCGLTMNWGSGPVEGRVNHITMIKRQVFGRAGLPLLRKRVLLTAQLAGAAVPARQARPGPSGSLVARAGVRGRLGVDEVPHHYGPGAGRGIPGIAPVTADQLLLVGDEPGGFLPGERKRSASGHPGPAAPLAHFTAGGAEPREAFQVLGQGRRLQPGYLRLRLDAEPLARDPERLGRGLPPPLPALPAAGDLAHEVMLAQQPQVVAHDPAVLAQVTGQRGGRGRPALVQAAQDALPHRVRQRPQFLNVPYFAGLNRLTHDARISVHRFPCK